MIDRQTAGGVPHDSGAASGTRNRGLAECHDDASVDLTAGTIPDAQTVFAQVLVTVKTHANGRSSGRLPANLQPPSRGRPSGAV